MKASTSICIAVLLPLLTSSSLLHRNPDEPVVEDDAYSTYNSTGQLLVSNRRPSTKSAGNGRLALINSRFSRRPRRKHTDPEHLRELLGGYFDSQWMSVDEPSQKEAAPHVNYIISSDSLQHQELGKHLQELNLTHEFLEGGGEKLSQDRHSIAVIEKWLLRKATCPVVYAWEDVGPMFWPRWIKRGECLNKRGTCSWPPGMYCVPTGTSTLHLLRWQCRLPKGKGRRRPNKQNPKKDWKKQTDPNQLNLRCHWIRIPYPITSECACTC